MNLDHYPIATDSLNFTYMFDSIGPNGIIRKVVSYRRITPLDFNYYNFSFGDWDKITGKVNDISISNINDTKKILLTVGLTTLQFVNHYPNAKVFIEGSTMSRTRLYQMSITQYFDEIDKLFDLEGCTNGNWEKYQTGINFEAILIKKKPNYL
jgi:hypothetical protein